MSQVKAESWPHSIHLRQSRHTTITYTFTQIASCSRYFSKTEQQKREPERFLLTNFHEFSIERKRSVTPRISRMYYVEYTVSVRSSVTPIPSLFDFCIRARRVQGAPILHAPTRTDTADAQMLPCSPLLFLKFKHQVINACALLDRSIVTKDPDSASCQKEEG